MLADASKSASAIAAVDMEKDKLRQTIGELQASLRKVVEQNDELKRALEKEVRNGAEMKHVVKVAARKAEDAENGRKELDKQVEEFRRRDLDRLSSYQQLASQFESKLAPIILENSQLKAQLAAVQMDNRLNNQGMQKNDHLLHEQQSELQHLEEKNERLQGQLDDLRRKIDERDGKLEAKRIEIRDLKESLARYDQEMSRIRKMVESERDDSVSRLREMEKRMEEERRADQEQRRLDQIEKKQSEVRMQQMSVELAEKEKSLISALADVENMKQKLSRANQETRVLVKAIDQQRALCEQKEDQIRRLQSAFRTVQVELQDTANSRHPRP
jgi:chromosome segregation ATPase